MLCDARTLPNGSTIDTDVCIVGAGVAGSALAREFMGKRLGVCLLESGGLQPDRATQSLHWGRNIGVPYYPLDTSRARFFGGSSHCWHVPLDNNVLGVRLRPLDAIDFEQRDWVPYSGWPFDKKHLDPYYRRAAGYCRIRPFMEGEGEHGGQMPRLPFRNGRVTTTTFQFAPRELFAREYLSDIRAADSVTAFLHANVTEIETDETAQRVTGLQAACLGGKSFSIRAKLFVLASGAIEVARLLLLSNRVNKAGLGNQHDLVGRFFMEHPHLWSGIYVPSHEDIFDLTGHYRIHSADGVAVMGKLALSEDVLRRERLLNYCTSIHARVCPEPRNGSRVAVGSMAGKGDRAGISGELTEIADERSGTLWGDIGDMSRSVYRRIKGAGKIRAFRLNHMSEQMPNPDSRVTLGEELDALGQRRAELDWRLSPLDMRTILRSQQIIDEELRSAGLGRLHIEEMDQAPPPNLTGGWHHMGTTRMHTDPRKGVVDEHCRVHGISNLFIAGPSVFPTGGYANPVFTVIALTLRLADHLKNRLAGTGAS